MNKNIFPINNHNIRKILEETSKRDFALLGESTHGTKEFYEIRLLITKLLVKNHNFNTIFLETEWSNGYILNKYIHSKISIDIKILLPKIFNKFPKWMTCNKYIHNLLIFLKSWNRINKKKVYIYGIDCQDIELAKKNVCNKSDLNCPIVSEIIKNYDIMNNPELNYWNIRDKFWLNIINSVKKYRKSKFILWSHNSHVGLSSANIRNDNNINIGYLLQQLYNIYIIGFSKIGRAHV